MKGGIPENVISGTIYMSDPRLIEGCNMNIKRTKILARTPDWSSYSDLRRFSRPALYNTEIAAYASEFHDSPNPDSVRNQI